MKDRSSYLLNLGKITSPHGVHGQVSVYSYADPLDGIFSYSCWCLSTSARPWLERGDALSAFVKARPKGVVKRKKELFVVQLELEEGGLVEDRTRAQNLAGHGVFINGAELPDLPADDFYWFELLGVHVYNLEGFYFGHIVNLFDNGANDVMVVHRYDDEHKKSRTKEYFLPYTNEHVQNVCRATNKMIIDWPEQI